MSTSRLVTSIQNRVCEIGRNVRLLCLDVWRSGIINRIKMDASRARTPPSLLGIDRRIAYANRKYHSGLMCCGVLRGFAGEKLSGSLSMSGERRVSISRIGSISIMPIVSLVVK